MKNISVLVILSFAISICSAQTSPPGDRELADAAFANRDYAQAIDMYQKILKRKSLKDLADIRFKLAESYRYTGKDDEAINWYEQAKAAGYADPNYLFHEANIYLKQGKYENAQKKANEFLSLQPNDKEATRLLNNATFALAATPEVSVYSFKNETALNSTYSDYGAVIVKDKLLFTSSRIEDKGQDVYKFDGQGFSDVYTTTYSTQDKNWSKPAKIAGLGSDGNDGSFTYCEKTKTAYFTRCNDNKGKSGFCSIAETTFDEANNTWSAPKTIVISGVQKEAYKQPAISTDGDNLYFISQLEGGSGGTDIWVMHRNANLWGEPKNLGNVINTDANEMFPTIYQDTMLYFSSEGHPGYGGLDIFYSVFTNGAWSKPVNLKLPYNSSADDFFIVYNNDKSKGYYSSNRPGGAGSDDIYSFFLTPVTLTVKGRVTDVDGNSPLVGAQVILSTATGNDTAFTNANGEYSFTLDKDKDYKINVLNPGYFGDSKKLTTQGEQFSKEFSKATGHNYDFSIKKIPKEEIKIDNIYYDYDSYNLREESKPSLDKLVKLLDDTPDALVQINSHTDERGKLAYNTTLSENRAKSVVEYLISKGINPTRLSAKGFAQTQPVVKGAKTEEEHQQNRRTTFQVLKQ